MPAGRPTGSKNKPKTNPPIGSKLPQYKDEQILNWKLEILDLLATGECRTVTSAAKKLKIIPARAQNWADKDKDFQQMIRYAREVAADELEEELRAFTQFVPKMFLLKGYRPMFRDNFKEASVDEGFRGFIEKLLALGEATKLGQQKVPEIEESTHEVVTIEPIQLPLIENKREVCDEPIF